MGTQSTTYSAQLSAITKTFDAACSAALTGEAKNLRTTDNAKVLDDTLTVLGTLCSELDKASEVTKTLEVTFTSQVDCIADVVANLEAVEAYTVSQVVGLSKSAFTTAQKALVAADKTLVEGVQSLGTEVSTTVADGFSNADTSVNGASSLLQDVIDRYQDGVSQTLKNAGTTFRTSDSTQTLDAAVKGLQAALKTADQDALSESDVDDIAAQVSAYISTIQSALKALPGSDLTYIQSAKVATLDQPKLKSYATLLQGVDDTFKESLDFITDETDVDPGEATELDSAVKAAESIDLPNMPKRD